MTTAAITPKPVSPPAPSLPSLMALCYAAGALTPLYFRDASSYNLNTHDSQAAHDGGVMPPHLVGAAAASLGGPPAGCGSLELQWHCGGHQSCQPGTRPARCPSPAAQHVAALLMRRVFVLACLQMDTCEPIIESACTEPHLGDVGGGGAASMRGQFLRTDLT